MTSLQKKMILLLLLLNACSIQHALSQGNEVCNGAIQVSVSQSGNDAVYNFAGSGVLWMKFIPDSVRTDFEYTPDSLSPGTNIEAIEIYEGSDCASMTLQETKIYDNSDSSKSNQHINLSFLDSGENYFLKIFQSPGANSGFRLALDVPDISGGCLPPSCDLITNGSFSVYNATCVHDHNLNPLCPDPFNGNCICGWQASHGTPNFYPMNFNPVMGVINVNGVNWGEGVYQVLQTPVISGRSYLLTFDYQNGLGAGGYNYRLHADLTNAAFGGGTCFNLLPPPGWAIPGGTFVATSLFTNVKRCFTANANYNEIWFYPTTTSTTTEWVSIDNVKLIPLDAPMPDQTIYCGESVTLCPPCINPDISIGYSWSTGETTPCITVAPTATTVYTLTIAVYFHGIQLCSYAQNVTVNVLSIGSVALQSGSTSLCTLGPETYTFHCNGASNFNYSVTPPNAFTVSNNSVTVNWTNIPATCATLQVEATAGNPPVCTSTSTFQVCVGCPGSPGFLTLCNRTASSVLSDPLFAPYINGNTITIPSGSWVSVNGIFTVDVPIAFNNSDIRFAKDAKAEVLASAVFEIQNQSHLHSCDGMNMWDGIFAEDPSARIYIHGNNLIEDAKNAVVSLNCGDIEINSTTFRNDFIGIKLADCNAAHTGKIYGNIFTGTGALLNPYSNYCPGNNYPACGIAISNVNKLQVGEPAMYAAFGRNNFQSIVCGIYSHNSTVDIYTCEFNNLIASCTLQAGTGIAVQNNSMSSERINVGDATASQKCIFNYCRIGISERWNCYGNIIGNSFSHCERGISNINSFKNNNLVKGNTFEDFKRGIYFFNATNNLQYGLEIHENLFNNAMSSFNYATYGKHAIYVENPVSASTNLWITGNVINYSQVGIFVRNVWEPCQIRDNTINFDILPQDALNTGTHHGIECENDNGLEITSNYIRWRNQPAAPSGFIDFMNGISINFSSSTTAISGGITENKIGPYPAVNSGTTYGMGSGINISSYCQGLSLYCNKITRCEEGVTLHNVSLNQQGYMDIQQHWYSNGNTFAYTPGQGGSYRISGTVLNQVEWAYINGLEDPFPYLSAIVNPHPTAYSFYQCLPPAPPDEEQRDDLFGELISPATTINPDYSGYEDRLDYIGKEKFYSSVVNDSSLISLGTTDDQEYEQLFTALENSNISKLQEAKIFLDSLNFTEAALKLNMLVDSNLYEHNKKEVMLVYLQTIAIDSSIDSAHEAILLPISNQHPIIGGEAVFWACAMLDKEVVNELPPLRKAGESGSFSFSDDSSISVYPNPAKNILYVKHKPCLNLTVQIEDAAGNQLMKKNLNTENEIEPVDISLLTTGSYVAKVKCSDLLAIARRFVIIK